MKHLAVIVNLILVPLFSFAQSATTAQKVELSQATQNIMATVTAQKNTNTKNLKQLEIKAVETKKNLSEELKNKKQGPGEGGGANSIDAKKKSERKLLDRYESENSIPLTFDDLARDVPLLDQRLKSFSRKVVGLRLALYKSPARSKRWVLTKLPLPNSNGCLNALLYIVKTRVVACQTEDFVRVDEDWYTSAQMIDRAWMLNHELLVGILMYNMFYNDETRAYKDKYEIILRRFNSAVMSVNKIGLADRWENQHSLNDFKSFSDRYRRMYEVISYEEYQTIKNSLERALPQFCQLTNGLTGKILLKEASDKKFWKIVNITPTNPETEKEQIDIVNEHIAHSNAVSNIIMKLIEFRSSINFNYNDTIRSQLEEDLQLNLKETKFSIHAREYQAAAYNEQFKGKYGCE